MSSTRYFAFIPSAGIGLRSGAPIPKQYIALAGQPMLMYALNTFSKIEVINHIFIVVRPEDEYIDNLLSGFPEICGKSTVLFHGGTNRWESVLNGLRMTREEINDEDWVLVHDAVRPGLTCSLAKRLIHTLHDDPVGGLLALPVVDTLKSCDQGMKATRTIPNSGLWMAQTPQMFRYNLLLHALELSNPTTDEASAIEKLGLRPRVIEGSLENFKITVPSDLVLAELLLRNKSFD